MVDRALRADPAERYATAAEMCDALRGALPAARASRLKTRVRFGAAAAAVAIIALFAQLRGPSTDGGGAAIDGNAVVILPFRVSSDSGLAYLREGMVDLFAARLTGDGGLRAVDTRTVLSAWQREYGERTLDLPADSALQFARRLGAAHVLLGDVVASGDGLTLNAAVTDAAGRAVGHASVAGAHDDLPALIDQVVGSLLVLSAGEDPQRLSALTSTSLPALRAYLEGQAAYRRGRYEEALQHYSDALHYDSTFALAGMGLAFAGGWTGGAAHLRERGQELAWRYRDRLSRRDRALLVTRTGPDYPHLPTVRQLIVATQQALDLAPDRAELWYELADLYFHFGAVTHGESARHEAEAAFRRSLDLDPSYAPSIHHLVSLLARNGEQDALRGMALAYLERDPTGMTTDYIRWRVRHALGTAAIPPPPPLDFMETATLGWIVMNAIDEGFALDDAREAAELMGARPGTSTQRLEAQLAHYSATVALGRTASASRAADALRQLQPDEHFVDRLLVLTSLYAFDDRSFAAAAARRLEGAAGSDLDRCVFALWQLHAGRAAAFAPARVTADRTIAETICQAVHAATAEVLRTGSAGPRVAALDSLLHAGPVSGPVVDGHTEYAHIALARLLAQTGRPVDALMAARRRLYFIGWSPYVAAAVHEEARLAETTGDVAGARRAWSHLLALHQDSDGDPLGWAAEASRALRRLAPPT